MIEIKTPGNRNLHLKELEILWVASEFYALYQSNLQTTSEGGNDRIFQIVRCNRDEDLDQSNYSDYSD